MLIPKFINRIRGWFRFWELGHWLFPYYSVLPWVILLVLFLLLSASVAIVLIWPFLFALAWSRFHSVQGYWWVRVPTVVVLISIAYLFYRIKKEYRKSYGAAEIAMGIVACWVVLKNIQADRMTSTIGLAASVYFIVRGIDNYFAGIKAPQKKTYKRSTPVDKSPRQK